MCPPYGNYLPFLRFAEALNIPWIIFSDAENTSEKNVKSNVQRQFSECITTKSESDSIVFLNDGNDFERQLIVDGYGDEIKQAIVEQTNYHNEQHKKAKEQEIIKYDDNKLYDIITGNKTQYGSTIADQITKSNKGLPPKIIKLFKKIAQILKI